MLTFSRAALILKLRQTNARAQAKLLGHVPGCAGAWLRHCRAGVHKQNNLHSVKPTELDETCALSLFPNKSWLSPQQIAELVYHIHVALLRQGKGVQHGNLIIL